MKLAGISEKVFLDRYSLKDTKGLPIEKSPEEMWRRVAKAVSGVEKKVKQKSSILFSFNLEIAVRYTMVYSQVENFDLPSNW